MRAHGAVPDPARPGRGLSRATYAVAAGVTLLLLALSARYGPHRDELYFLAAGDHPQWGYPDQPPLTPLLARLADLVAPGSLVALRVVPALVAGAVVLVTADLARALGGGRPAQLLAAVATATGAGVLAIAHLLSTATFDLLVWTVLIRLVVAILQHDRQRLWLVAGAVLGVGLQNKNLVGFLAAGLVVGIAATPGLRHHLRSPWAWGGAAVALLIWLPNLVWQAQNGWPQAELGADIREEYGNVGGLAELVLLQAVMINPLGAVLAAIGGVAAFRRPEWRFVRPVPIAYVLLLVVFALTGGKNYYLLGLLPALAAAGSVVVEQRWSSVGVRRFTAAVAVTALFPLPALLPVLPAQTLGDTFWPALNEDQLETIGWPSVVGTVRGVVDELPRPRRCGSRRAELRRGRGRAVVRRRAAGLQRAQRLRRLGAAAGVGDREGRLGRLRRARRRPARRVLEGGNVAHRRRQRGGRQRGLGLRRSRGIVGAGLAAPAPPLRLSS